ncbi:MAG: hypothetical protein Q8N74_01820 [Sulfuricella sp.]|nr:hypothetical protein [Sulfuricella sp.]
MKERLNREIRISAFSDGFIDLDEFESSLELGKAIAAKQQANISCVTLDLRQCYLLYQHSSLYLDQALRLLRVASMDTKGKKLLRIMTSIDFGAIEPMAGVFFQISDEVSSGTNDDLVTVVTLINRYCETHGIDIRIEVYDQNATAGTEHPETEYVFPGASNELAT